MRTPQLLGLVVLLGIGLLLVHHQLVSKTESGPKKPGWNKPVRTRDSASTPEPEHGDPASPHRESDVSSSGERPCNAFFCLRPEVTNGFEEHWEYLVKNINANWGKQPWKHYSKRSIDDCHSETPECEFWKAVGGNAAEKPYRKCCVEHRKLRDTAVWVAKKLDDANIRYFWSTGSALGLYRHNGTIIPWDTDVDIAIFPEDAEKMKSILDGNGEHFFQKDPQGKPMYWVHASSTGKPRGGPHVEVFFDKVYTSHQDALLPLQRCSFYGHDVSCPSKAMLDVWFKSGWKTYSGCHYHGDAVATIYDRGKRKMVRKC